MINIKLQKLKDQASDNALHNVWGKDAYKVNMAILKIDHNDCAAYTRLAKYYKLKDDITKAKSMYLKALDIDPENRAALNNLNDIKKDQEESDAVEKIVTIKELLKEAQKSMLKSKYSRAAKLYAKAYSMEPLLTYAVDQASAYKKMGEYDKIEKLYTHLMEDIPTQTDAKAIENAFKTLRQKNNK